MIKFELKREINKVYDSRSINIYLFSANQS